MLSSRALTIPPLVSDLVIDTDSESEDEIAPKTPPTPTILPSFLTQPHKHTSILPSNQRPIAGSKRVYRFRETQGVHISQGGAEVLQSITASPALGHTSFEVRYIYIYHHCWSHDIADFSSPSFTFNSTERTSPAE